MDQRKANMVAKGEIGEKNRLLETRLHPSPFTSGFGEAQCLADSRGSRKGSGRISEDVEEQASNLHIYLRRTRGNQAENVESFLSRKNRQIQPDNRHLQIHSFPRKISFQNRAASQIRGKHRVRKLPRT